jgi:hypothetical protein
MVQIGGRNVATNDLGIMGGALAMFIVSFFPWFGKDFGFASVSRNGWGTGFLSWLPILLSLAVAGLVAARVFGNVQLPSLQVGWNFLVLALLALAVLCLLIKLLIGWKPSGVNIHAARKVGIYLALIVAAIQTFFAFAAFKLSGEALPGGRRL